MLIGIILLILTVSFGIVGVIYGYLSEKKSFNNGKCTTKCGGTLRLFDIDSQGGRGYVCNRCGRHVWISYKRIDMAPKPFRGPVDITMSTEPLTYEKCMEAIEKIKYD